MTWEPTTADMRQEKTCLNSQCWTNPRSNFEKKKKRYYMHPLTDCSVDATLFGVWISSGYNIMSIVDVPYCLCGQRDANVNVCRRSHNWIYQTTSQLTLLNLQLFFHTLEMTWLLRGSSCLPSGESVVQRCWKAPQWFCVHLRHDASSLFCTLVSTSVSRPSLGTSTAS